MNLIFGPKEKPPGYRFETSDYSLFQAILVQEGLCWLTVQNSAIAVKPGMVCCLPFGSQFILRCEETTGYRGIFVHITGESIAEYAGEACAFAAQQDMLALAEIIMQEVYHPYEVSTSIHFHLGMLFGSYALYYLRSRQQQEENQAESWVRYACQCIERTIHGSQSLEDSLRGIPLSYRQLSRYFLRILAITPKQYQLQCRVQAACHLLRTTVMSITNLALDVGFSSSQHFSTQFSRMVGCSPTAYRFGAPVTHRWVTISQPSLVPSQSISNAGREIWFTFDQYHKENKL